MCGARRDRARASDEPGAERRRNRLEQDLRECLGRQAGGDRSEVSFTTGNAGATTTLRRCTALLSDWSLDREAEALPRQAVALAAATSYGSISRGN
jgi:hypothetical protein